MGYYTKFRGGFTFKPKLTSERAVELEDHMEEIETWKLVWSPSNKEWVIVWDECDAKYDLYRESIFELVDKVKKLDLNIQGSVLWRGEEFTDNGIIQITDNQIKFFGAVYQEDAPWRAQEDDFGDISWNYPTYP